MAEAQHYRYDVYISYSQDDEGWVEEWLLPRLEGAGLAVCLDATCFEPGAPRVEETERSVRESRRTLVILTPAWVESQWDSFEALLVHAQDPSARGRRLIPLLLKPCDPPERVKLLQWVDFTDPARQKAQLLRVVDAIKGQAVLPELRPEDAFPSPKQRRWELRWYAMAGVAAVLTLSVLVGWIWSQSRCEHTMPEKQYNVAVADFLEADPAGKSVKSADGRVWAQRVVDFLTGDEAIIRELSSQHVDIWGTRRLCSIPPVTEQNAEEVAKKIGATVLLYGELQTDSDGRQILAPMLYLSGEAAQDLATELQGPHAMGSPISISPDLAGPTDVNDALRRRMQALAPLLLGLARFSRGSAQGYEEAIRDFENATKTEWGQQSGEGQELLYLFLGSAYLKRATFLEQDPRQRAVLIDKAQEQFRHAVELNPDYGRAYNGLGNALFQSAWSSTSLTDSCPDPSGIDKLTEAYHYSQLALAAADKPISGDVEFRARLGMGLAQLRKGLCLPEGQFAETGPVLDDATNLLYLVLTEYDENPLPQRMLPAALASHALGVAFLTSSVRIRLNDGADGEKSTSELSYALQFLDQAKSITDQLNSQEANRLAEQVQDVLSKAQCLQTRSEDAQALASCGIQLEGTER